MSRLYDALKNAQATIPAAAPAAVRLQPQAEDAPILRLSQAIDSRLTDFPRRVIQLIGCGPEEGVAAVARRLARLSAVALRRSVLLLDGVAAPPVSRPAVAHPAFAGLPSLEAGLPGRADPALPYDSDSLFAQTEGGGIDPERLRHAWERLRQGRDLVVVVTPPAGSPVGLAVAPTVDGVVLVVEADRTLVSRAEAARDMLLDSGANVLGVVLDKRRCWGPKSMWEMF